MGKGRYHQIAVLVLLGIIQAAAAFGAERQLTLSEAVAAALQGNNELRASKDSLLAQREEVGIARSPLLPHVAFEEGAVRTDNPPGVFMAKLNQRRFSQSDFDINALNNPKPTTDFQTLVSVDQPIFASEAFIGLTMAKKEYAAQIKDARRVCPDYNRGKRAQGVLIQVQ